MRSVWIEVRRHGPPILGVGLLSWMVAWGYRYSALRWLVWPALEVLNRIEQPYQPPDVGLGPRPSLFLVSVCLATTFAFFTTLPMLMGLIWTIVRPGSFAAPQRSLWQFRLIAYVVLALVLWYLRSALEPQVFAHLVVDCLTVPTCVWPIPLEEYVGFAAARLVVYGVAALSGIFSVFVSRARRGEGRRRIGALLPLGMLSLAFVSVSAVLLPMQSALQARWILPMAGLYAMCLLASLLPRWPESRR